MVVVVWYELAARPETVRLGRCYRRPLAFGEVELVGEAEERNREIRGSLITWRLAVRGRGGRRKGKEVAGPEKAQGLA